MAPAAPEIPPPAPARTSASRYTATGADTGTTDVAHPLALAHAPDDIAERARISRAELDELTAYVDPGRWKRLGELLARSEAGAAVLLHEVPVLPPYLRPMKLLDDGHWTIAGLNDLYRRVVNRAFRLRRLREPDAPDVITANEYKMMGSRTPPHRPSDTMRRVRPATLVS